MKKRSAPNLPGLAPDSSPAEAGRGALGGALGWVLGARRHTEEAPCFDDSAGGGGVAASGGASAILRRVLPDIYFINTPSERSERHMELLRRLDPQASAPLIDFHSTPGLPLTECTLCAFDEISPGLLAKLCGTIAALNLSIHTAFIYTLRLDAQPSEGAPGGREISLAPASDREGGRAVALNTFLVSESYFGHDRALTPKTQRKLKAELCHVLAGQATVSKMLSRRSFSFPPLHIHELAVENRDHEEQTRILLRTGDSFGVLYRATSALAELRLNIATAQVSTREEAADDLFFVTQDGAKVPGSELAAVAASLRTRLQSDL